MSAEREEHSGPVEKGSIKYGVLRTDLESHLMIQAAEETGGITIAITGEPGDLYKDAPIDADPEVIAEAQDLVVPEGHLYLTVSLPSDIFLHTAYQQKFLKLCKNYAKRVRAVEETKIEY